MLIIPEREIVIILTPRTGSGALRRAVLERFPKSMLIYRHMEADGIPAGYDRWRRIGVVRHPLTRLWSLYKFLKDFGGDHDGDYIAAQRASVAMPFSEWIVGNQTVFTSPYDSAGLGRYWPQFTVRHPLPENRKSQFLYLRPDLGTEVWQYDQVGRLWQMLDLPIIRTNVTSPSSEPGISIEAAEHMRRVFAWDYQQAWEKAA